MTLPDTVDVVPRSPEPRRPPLGGASRPVLRAGVAVLAAGLLGTAAALAVAQGGLVAALMLAPYLGVLLLTWYLTRGNLVVVTLVAYLVAPSPADNLLPQVFIFSKADIALRERDLLFLADIVLLVALIALRTAWPKGRLLRAWLVALLVLAAYPIVVGAVAGVGQSVPALLQGAVMPVRGIGLVVLVVAWSRSHGWERTVRDVVRTVVLAGVLFAFVVAVLKIGAIGQQNLSLAGYPLVVDSRPAVPGWGNNILANLFCTCIAALVFGARVLGWRWRWRVAVAVVLLIGLAYTEVRIAMLLALVLVEVPVAALVLRKVWPRRGAVVAVLSAVLVAVLLGLSSTIALYYLNPRFSTLTPSFVLQYLPGAGDVEANAPSAVDPETGIDLGGASISTRGGLFKGALEIWGEHPVLGTGWNGWGWAKQDTSYPQNVAVDPHNGITWLLVDAGAVGVLLLYLLPVVQAVRRWDLWWLWGIPAVATALEMVNPNLRNGHFAVIFWSLVALGFAAAARPSRYTYRESAGDLFRWLRGIRKEPS